jgi:hypothetical protein
MKSIKMIYPYNETFDYFGEPRASIERAQSYIDRMNTCKGGHWVLRGKEEYDAWIKKNYANKHFYARRIT